MSREEYDRVLGMLEPYSHPESTGGANLSAEQSDKSFSLWLEYTTKSIDDITDALAGKTEKQLSADELDGMCAALLEQAIHNKEFGPLRLEILSRASAAIYRRYKEIAITDKEEEKSKLKELITGVNDRKILLDIIALALQDEDLKVDRTILTDSRRYKLFLQLAYEKYRQKIDSQTIDRRDIDGLIPLVKEAADEATDEASENLEINAVDRENQEAIKEFLPLSPGDRIQLRIVEINRTAESVYITTDPDLQVPVVIETRLDPKQDDNNKKDMRNFRVTKVLPPQMKKGLGLGQITVELVGKDKSQPVIDNKFPRVRLITLPSNLADPFAEGRGAEPLTYIRTVSPVKIYHNIDVIGTTTGLDEMIMPHLPPHLQNIQRVADPASYTLDELNAMLAVVNIDVQKLAHDFEVQGHINRIRKSPRDELMEKALDRLQKHF